MLPRKARHSGRAAVIALRALAATLFAALAVLAGCGDDGGAEPTSNDPFAEGDARLTVTLDPDGAGGPENPATEELSCEELSEDPACLAVRDLSASDFDPTPPGQACTELFGGPDEATVTGEINGEDVDTELTRANGCEIERFDRALPLLQALFDGYEPGAAIEG